MYNITSGIWLWLDNNDFGVTSINNDDITIVRVTSSKGIQRFRLVNVSRSSRNMID